MQNNASAKSPTGQLTKQQKVKLLTSQLLNWSRRRQLSQVADNDGQLTGNEVKLLKSQLWKSVSFIWRVDHFCQQGDFTVGDLSCQRDVQV